jgi:hypothetical protein
MVHDALPIEKYFLSFQEILPELLGSQWWW